MKFSRGAIFLIGASNVQLALSFSPNGRVGGIVQSHGLASGRGCVTVSPLQMASDSKYNLDIPASRPPTDPAIEARLKEIQARRAKILEEIAAAEADREKLEQSYETAAKQNVEAPTIKEEKETPKPKEEQAISEPPSVPIKTNTKLENKPEPSKPVDIETKLLSRPEIKKPEIQEAPPLPKSEPRGSAAIAPIVDDEKDAGFDISSVSGPASLFGGFLVAAVGARSFLQSRDVKQDELKEDADKLAVEKATSAKEKKTVADKVESPKESKIVAKAEEIPIEEPSEIESLTEAPDISVPEKDEITTATVSSLFNNSTDIAQKEESTSAKKSSLFNSDAIGRTEEKPEEENSSEENAESGTEEDGPRLSRFRKMFLNEDKTSGNSISDDKEESSAESIDESKEEEAFTKTYSLEEDSIIEPGRVLTIADLEAMDEPVNGDALYYKTDQSLQDDNPLVEEILQNPTSDIDNLMDEATSLKESSDDTIGKKNDKPADVPKNVLDFLDNDPGPEDITYMETQWGSIPVNGDKPKNIDPLDNDAVNGDLPGSELISVAQTIDDDISEPSIEVVEINSEADDGEISDTPLSESALFAKSEEQEEGSLSSSSLFGKNEVDEAESPLRSSPLFAKSETQAPKLETPKPVANDAELSTSLFKKKKKTASQPALPKEEITLNEIPVIPDISVPESTIPMFEDIDYDLESDDDRLEAVTEVFLQVNDLLNKKKRGKEGKD